jgi:DNA-cytosine methyltransferase
MHRTDRDNEICFESLEEALAKSPETYGHIDLLCAGWPCQGASIAGKRQGFKHKETGLWKEVARCLRIFKPKWFLGENVPGLLSVNGGKDFQKVLSDLLEIGYGISWRILDSQYFGVPQRRKRVFIVGYFGDVCPPEILFEPKSSRRNDKKKQKIRERGLCVSATNGKHNDPQFETLVASTIGTSINPDPNYGMHFIAEKVNSLTAKSYGDKGWPLRNEWNTVIAQTIGATPRGNTSFVWQDTYITEINSDRKRETSGIPKGLDSRRGIVIGNAVTVQVAQWIGKRIIEWEKNQRGGKIYGRKLERMGEESKGRSMGYSREIFRKIRKRNG